MKERPILFSAPMVRAILDGSKSQTRRVIKLPHQNPLGVWEPTRIGSPSGGRTASDQTIPEQGAIWHTRTGDCITYSSQPGDRLWVRETWANVGTMDPGLTVYRADYPACVPAGYENLPPVDEITWKPSIHMFRKDSRILLEVTGVRVERLQDISYEDAIAEGVHNPATVPPFPHTDKETPVEYARRTGYPQRRYAALWEEINGAGSWDANPWVWCIEFKGVAYV